MFNFQAALPGLYHYDGQRIRLISSCEDCHLSFQNRVLELAREITDRKTFEALERKVRGEVAIGCD